MAQLTKFIQADKDSNITEELLVLWLIKWTITGEDIFEIANTAFDKFGLKWSSLSSVYVDGASALVGEWKDFIGIVHERTVEPSRKFNKFSLHYPPTKSIKFTNFTEV